ncbi:hypothetical protein STPYR_10477 [uncultured Stenotrophomonas sp.]|uniref:RelA/SpoT domain-containing protein n=1 Tax=uncultured Stenotrophomonas sp. TaxID=165438 RepID=A0A1Y5Q722_9GAMM|nr:hypothetical protein STPYR_10477 [uncultured Stenotrophomonas sp.]
MIAVTRSSLSGLDALLQRPSCGALSGPLRQALQDAWQQPDAAVPPRLPWPVLADTLDSLALLSADEAVVVAALLFDLPGLRARLPDLPLGNTATAVRGLLDGQDAADQVWALHAGREAGRNSEGLRRLLLSIVHDLRVVPILLARQLACMRAADRLPEEQRRALAQLTRDIHAPLANRLGIWQLKWELEDLAFRFLDADTYRHIAREVDETRIARERYVEAVKRKLSAALAAHGIRAEVSGRPKHIYSIWRKMQKKQLAFEQLYDLRAVRVMVDDVAACYAALGIVLLASVGLPCLAAPRWASCCWQAWGCPVSRRRAGHRARLVDADSERVRRLHRPPQGQRLPLAAHRGDRSGRAHRGSADPHLRNACASRTGRGRALEIQGGRQGRGEVVRPQDHLDAAAAGAGTGRGQPR